MKELSEKGFGKFEDNGILSSEGIDVFKRILSGNRLSQVIVSTKDLHTMIQQVNTYTKSVTKNNDKSNNEILNQRHKRPNLKTPYMSPNTSMESSIAEIFQSVLGLEQVGINDNFFELGGESLLAIQVISKLQDTFKVELPLSNLFETPTVATLTAAILRFKAEKGEYAGISSQLPVIVADAEHRYEPFPLTELQQAYWVGRNESFSLGNVATHAYIEFDSTELDIDRFNKSWQKIVKRHDMLRAIVQPDGMQKILEEVPDYEVRVTDMRGRPAEEVEKFLETTREFMSHQVLPADKWPLFDISATIINNELIRIHFSIDGLLLDGWSYQILFPELVYVYQHSDASLEPLEISFRDYVVTELKLRESKLYKQSLEYWRKRLPMLPPAPDIPLLKTPKELTNPRFTRLESKIEKNTWDKLKARASKAGLTPSGLLLSAYAEVIAAWSKSPKFTINVPRFNRLPLHAQVNDLIGEFASFTFLSVDMTKEESFETRARRIQEQMWKDLEHMYVSGVKVLRELSQVHGNSSAGIMPIVFTEFPKGRGGKDTSLLNALGDIGDSVYTITQTSQVWIDNQVYDWADGLHFNWDVVKELFPDQMVEDMFESYCNLLGYLAKDEEMWSKTTFNLLPSRQLEIRNMANSATLELPQIPLQKLFADQVKKVPEQNAVVTSKHNLSYKELYCLTNKVGRYLRELGVQPNELVAVVMDKGWEQVVAVLGVLNSGAAYMPVDSEVPKDRLWYLFENSGARIVLTQSWLDKELDWPEGIRRIVIDSDEFDNIDDKPVEYVQKPEDIVYVIYTSGSTGNPKGVMVTHAGALNSVLYTNEYFKISSGDSVLALTALHHDMSVYDVFGVLGAGGTVVIPDAGKRKDPQHWIELIINNRITIWNSVPAMMEMLLEYIESHPGITLESLRLSFLGGDWIPVTIPDRIKAFSSSVKTVSVGGPTETTLWNIWYVVESVDPLWKSIPYGKPISNTKYYVLNDNLEECPEWVPGVLYCAGVGVSKGYWHDEKKTQEKFIHHPITGERLYCTGDLGRYMPDGNIEFIGRADFQFNVLGYRVEPGEIEAVLLKHSLVRTAIVSASGEKQGHKRPIAYVVPKQSNSLTKSQLQEYLREKLPEHMLPGGYVFLEALPLNANGKVDRSALPEYTAAKGEAAATVIKADSDIFNRVLNLTQKVVDVGEVSREANLIDYGMNSVDIIRIFNLLEKEFGDRPGMQEFFSNPTLDYLCNFYENNPQISENIQTTETGKLAVESTENIISSFKLILDPDERSQFRKKRPGIRQNVQSQDSIELIKPKIDKALLDSYMKRRSYRLYNKKPISFKKFSSFLSSIYGVEMDDKYKYLYSSAGGLYPVQIYVHIKEGGVKGVEKGIYYYNPAQHSLQPVTVGVDITEEIHTPFLNRPIYEKAAFSVFLIAELSAIAPLYGDMSMHFVTLEAGILSQHLEASAPKSKIGLCQIGNIEFEQVKHLFKLGETQVFIHSLIGGMIDENTLHNQPTFQDDYYNTSGSKGEWVEVEI